MDPHLGIDQRLN